MIVSIKSTLSFLIAAVLTIQSFSLPMLAVPYLSIIFASASIKTSIGGTMIGIDSQLKGVLTSTMIDVVLLLIGVQNLTGNALILTVIFVLFGSSVILAYFFHAPGARRFALAMHAMTMVQMATVKSTPVYFPVQLLTNLVLGFALALVFSVLPFPPRLAQDELLDRFQLSIRTLSRCFSSVTRAYLSTEPIAPHLLQSDAKGELEAVFLSLTEMRRLQGESLWECSLWQMFFPCSISLASPIQPDVDRCEQLYWLLSNLVHTLTTLRYSSYHAAFVQFLRPSFVLFDSAQRDYLKLLSSEDPSGVSIREIEKLRARLEDAMAQLQDAYLLARRNVYGYNAETVKANMKNEKIKQVLDAQLTFDQSIKQKAAQARAEQHHAEQHQHEIEMAHLEHALNGGLHATTHQTPTDEHQPNKPSPADPFNHFGPHSASPPKSVSLFHSTQEVFIRSCFYFYVHRYHTVLQSLTIVTEHAALGDDNLPGQANARSTSRFQLSHSRRALFKRKLRAIKGLAYAGLRPWQWSLFGMQPFGDFKYLVRQFVNFVCHPTIDWLWLRSSVKIACIICIASLISIVPGHEPILPNSVWCVFTAAILTSDTEGALWQRAMYRLFGTLIGGLIGYLILLAFPDSWVGAIGLMCIWNIPCQFVQLSSYNYMGSLASFTAIIVVFGVRLSNTEHLSLPEFALSRMVDIAIGVFIALFISSIFFPTSSIRRLRGEIILSIDSMKSAVDKTIAIYDSLVSKDEMKRLNRYRSQNTLPTVLSSIRSQNLNDGHVHEDDHDHRSFVADRSINELTVSIPEPESPVSPMPSSHDTVHIEKANDDLADENDLLARLVDHSTSVQMSLARQAILLGEAVYEPVSFFHTFPTAQYREISTILRRLWRLILTLEPALRAVAAHSRSTDNSHIFQQSASLRVMLRDVDTVLGECKRSVASGVVSDEFDCQSLTLTAQTIQADFAHSMNEMAFQIRQGKMALFPTDLLVPNAVFLHGSLETSQLVLILEQAIRRLSVLEGPVGYDD